LSAKNGRLSLKLLPYSLAYFKGMDPAYDWPPHVTIDSDGKPIVALEGLTGSGGFIMA
jgi:hypothetical protein